MSIKSTLEKVSEAIIPRAEARGQTSMPLQKWLWRSYLRSAIIPLLFIEITFLAIYWISNSLVYKENISAVNAISDKFLTDVAAREAETISSTMAGVSSATELFSRQTLKALNGNYNPPDIEKRRYKLTERGAFISTHDIGTTASFYSGIVPIGPQQIEKVWKLAALDPLMIDIKNSNPL